jgi:hypothetical protein
MLSNGCGLNLAKADDYKSLASIIAPPGFIIQGRLVVTPAVHGVTDNCIPSWSVPQGYPSAGFFVQMAPFFYNGKMYALYFLD